MLRLSAFLLVAAFVGDSLLGEALAQTPLVFTGEVRHRSEFDAKSFDPEQHAFDVHLLRSRLGVAATPLPDVTVFIQVQDSRVWGSENPALARGTLDGSADQIDFHQAYFAVSDVFDRPVLLQVGRQELAYGNQRLVGVADWSNVARSFDAAKLRYEPAAGRLLALDVFAARLVETAGDPSSQNLYGLYTTWGLADDLRLDAFLFADTDNDRIEIRDAQNEVVDERWRLRRLTPGLYLHGQRGPIDLEAEAILQTGTAGAADVGAHLLSAGGGYLFDPERALRLGAAFTRLSGTDLDDPDSPPAFDTLFGTNHKFYGFMDYFPFVFSTYGLHDFLLSASFAATPDLVLRLDAHHFTAASDVPVGPGETARTYGQELDLTARYRYNPAFSVQAGASAFLPGPAVERPFSPFSDDETTFWLYLTTSVRF